MEKVTAGDPVCRGSHCQFPNTSVRRSCQLCLGKVPQIILTVFIPLACDTNKGVKAQPVVPGVRSDPTYHHIGRDNSGLQCDLLDGTTVVCIFRRSNGCLRTHRRLFMTQLPGAYPGIVEEGNQPRLCKNCKQRFEPPPPGVFLTLPRLGDPTEGMTLDLTNYYYYH